MTIIPFPKQPPTPRYTPAQLSNDRILVVVIAFLIGIWIF